MQRAHLLWSAFHVIAAEGNQPEINPFRVVTHITVKWNVILTLGTTVACNHAGVMLFKWHHFVRFQLVHTIGGFMMIGARVKLITRGYQNSVVSMNQSTIPPSFITEFRCSSQELVNMESCGCLDLRLWSQVIFHFLYFLL